MAALHQRPAASFDNLVGEREQFDRAGNSPSSKTNPSVLTALAWPKSHKWSLLSTITPTEIDFQPTLLDGIRRY
jgi:hypothetical protein